MIMRKIVNLTNVTLLQVNPFYPSKYISITFLCWGITFYLQIYCRDYIFIGFSMIMVYFYTKPLKILFCTSFARSSLYQSLFLVEIPPVGAFLVIVKSFAKANKSSSTLPNPAPFFVTQPEEMKCQCCPIRHHFSSHSDIA